MTLPKSVKVRSTCNACQQAKIRCSHEKPSCRRCQKHNIECVYSVSRRLGRPAKKRDPNAGGDGPRKKGDNYTGSKTKVGEDSQEADFSDNWLQDFITDVPVPGVPESSAPSMLDMEAVTENSTIRPNANTTIESLSSSTSIPADDTSLPYYDPALLQSSPDTLDMDKALLLMDMDTSTSPADTLPSISTPVSPPINDTSPNPPPQAPPPAPQSSTFHPPPPPQQITHQPYEYEYTFPDISTIGLDVDPSPYTSPRTTATATTTTASPNIACQCHCHESTLRELLRVNMILCTASRLTTLATPTSTSTGATATMDAILNSQHALQNLAENIMACTLCTGTRVTLLTVVMVSIDSLVSVMESVATASPTMTGEDGGFAQYPSPKGSEGNAGAGAGTGGVFKSQLGPCPLLVGCFRMPSEEKYAFFRQVLQTRLGGLLTTVRRIQFCTQEMLAGSAAKGRLVIMMETDRRLQVVMMRMRMCR